MLRQVHVWVLRAAVLVVLFIAFGGGEALCADCDAHDTAAEQNSDGSSGKGTSPEAAPQPCGCNCHIPVGWIQTPALEVAASRDVSNVTALVQAVPTPPVADIDLPPQLA